MASGGPQGGPPWCLEAAGPCKSTRCPSALQGPGSGPEGPEGGNVPVVLEGTVGDAQMYPSTAWGPTGGSLLTSTALFFPVRDFPAQGDAQASGVCSNPGPRAHTSSTNMASHPPFAFHSHLDGSGDVAPAVLACLLFCSGRRSIHEPPSPPHPANHLCQPQLPLQALGPPE